MSGIVVSVDVREDASSRPDFQVWRAIVETSRGRCYYAVYAEERPSDDKVKRDWSEDIGTSRAKNWKTLNA